MSDVSNGPDWWQGADGKWYAPGEQPNAQASVPPPASGFSPKASSSTSSKSSFAFEMKRLNQPERITAVATLVLLISLFLQWFSYGPIPFTGLWHGWMYLVLILCLAILVDLVAKGGFAETPLKLPMSEEQLLLYATAINLVLTVLAFVFKPGGYGISGVGWSFGAFVGLAAAVVAAAPTGLPAIRARRG